jgi:ribosomal protein S18 acetylase RimI-like enzyme
VYEVKETDDIEEALFNISSWGYPRSMDNRDTNCLFLEIGDRVGYVWFDDIGNDCAAVHISIKPEFRGRAFTWTTWIEVLVYAIEQGWIRLYAMNAGEVMVGYVKRLGFVQDSVPEWYYFPLEVSDGQVC